VEEARFEDADFQVGDVLEEEVPFDGFGRTAVQAAKQRIIQRVREGERSRIREEFTERYFVDKFPMFHLPNPSSPPVVSFSFVDPGLESLDSFKTHLDAYTRLFLQLQEVRFHYIATRDTHHQKAKRLFMGLFDRHWDPDSPGGIVDYFCLRKRADAGEGGRGESAAIRHFGW